MRAPEPPRQQERLAALRSFHILDTPREPRFDRLVELAADLCAAPIAVINLIDEERQWFKAETGLGIRETPLDTSICSHVILQPGLTVIADTLADPRLADNPLCIGGPNLRFYAGALLGTDDGLPIGTLCVLDKRPRDLDPLQRRALCVLAEQVMAQMQLTRELRLASELRREVDHRVKNSLGMVSALLNLQSRESGEEAVRTALKFARDRVAAVAIIHDQLHAAGAAGFVDLGEFTARLARSIASQTRRDVEIGANVPAIALDASRAVNVGIIVNELVTNALRHGFALGGSGRITIEGAVDGDRLRLTVADNGVGLPRGFDPAASSGLGMRMARTLTGAMGGRLAWSSDARGTRFTFDAPLRAGPGAAVAR